MTATLTKAQIEAERVLTNRRAIAPKEVPLLPEDCVGWARSTRRAGGMYHAHVIGQTACGSIRLDRHHSEEPRGLGDFQYWGVCPTCFRKGGNVQ